LAATGQHQDVAIAICQLPIAGERTSPGGPIAFGGLSRLTFILRLDVTRVAVKAGHHEAHVWGQEGGQARSLNRRDHRDGESSQFNTSRFQKCPVIVLFDQS
jgi:hypothetical protein